MICPHCARSLLRKQRSGQICSFCRRRYALDPKTNPLRLHDIRVRKVLDRITDEGRHRVAPGQLWYALSRRSLRESRFGAGCLGGAFLAGGFLTFGGLVSETVPVTAVGGVLVLVGLALLVARASGAGLGRPPVPRAAFRPLVLDPWKGVYGGLPPGVVDDRSYPARGSGVPPARSATAGPAGPRRSAPAVLLCPDPSVAVFLTAAGLPQRHGLVLAPSLDEVRALPSGGPVLVLHDADAAGALLVMRARAALPGRRVVDAGLPLRRFRALPRAVPFRDPAHRPDAAALDELRASGGFDASELAWLARGWSYPLVGVAPAKLLAAVERAAGRAVGPGDPDRRRAEAVGFLTWPGTAGPERRAGR
ncbi:hypothetical protein [uncultured Streptomyces sp.]|uniref:hypothetical protein n=1 Tax=uncultured Streptomyces sp. TaxID=174707 RepID=UPI002617EF3F|nr:hypothetical protein [uncultured Streptomyces sp.]